MPHKADVSFFDKKASWSVRKDYILQYYLKPYLANVSRIGKPIVIVDCFAGRGRFLDGSDGSPRLIADRIREVACKPGSPKIRLIAIEKEASLIAPLSDALQEYSFASVREGTFSESSQIISELAENSVLFLYIDPYAVVGLDWSTIQQGLVHIKQSNSSVELLLNFNAHAFVRTARSALRQTKPEFTFESDFDTQENETDWSRLLESQPTAMRLSETLGGDWWQAIFLESDDPDVQRNQLVATYCDRLRKTCQFVCPCEIKEKPSHRVPKYVLIFASRHPNALVFMNDAVASSRDRFLEEFYPKNESLFDTRPLELAPEPESVRPLIRSVLQKAGSPLTRRVATVQVIELEFGAYSETVIRQQINAMFKEGQIMGVEGVQRLNDDARIQSARP